ncbi:hsp20/alpha crystallin family domain-containing protein [Ditylenchus destructor]|nr:hsp20/alpha crystallin family domain-containing protein [Ditylenchus destructor]
MSLVPFDDLFGYNRRISPFHSSWMSPFSHTSPLMYSALHDSLGQLQQLERELGHLDEPSVDDKGDFTFRCNVQGYRPEELQVDVHGNQLVIHGEHQHNDARQSVHRTFKRMVALPENVQKDTVQCSIDERGRLEVRAHSKTLPMGQQRKNIPIGFRKSEQQIEGEQQKQLDGQKK